MFLLQPCPSPPPAPKDPNRPAPRLLQGFADVPASTWFRWPGCSRVLKTSCVSSAREGRGSWAAASSCPCPSITPSRAAFSSHRPGAQVSKERPGGERGVLCEHTCVSHLVGAEGLGARQVADPFPSAFPGLASEGEHGPRSPVSCRPGLSGQSSPSVAPVSPAASTQTHSAQSRGPGSEIPASARLVFSLSPPRAAPRACLGPARLFF